MLTDILKSADLVTDIHHTVTRHRHPPNTVAHLCRHQPQTDTVAVHHCPLKDTVVRRKDMTVTVAALLEMLGTGTHHRPQTDVVTSLLPQNGVK